MLLYHSCVMFPLLPLRVSYFSCYAEVSLNSKLECSLFKKRKKKKKKKFPKIFQSILSRMDKCNLFLSTNVLLFYVLTILIHYFALLFSILSQKKHYVKRKYSVKLHDFFFVFFVGWTYISRGSLFIKVVSQ